MTVQRLWRAIAIMGLVAVVASTGPTGTQAQGADDLAALRTQVRQLYNEGKYAAAIPIAERYVALARQKHGEDHIEFATAISWLAGLYEHGQGRYAEAEALLKRAIAINEKVLGRDHPDVADALNNLAVLYRVQGRYADAEPLYKRSLAIREKALGRRNPGVGQSLNNLALLYRAEGRYAEAEPLYKRALIIYEKALGPDHLEAANTLNNLAWLYQVQGRYAEAEPICKRALAIREKALGPDHPDVAIALNTLALLYRSQGRYPEAEPLLKRAVAINEKALGTDHPSVGQSLNNLALLYRVQGRYAEAEPLYKHTVTILEMALGPDHPNVAASLNNIAEIYRVQGRYAEAEPLYKRAVAINEKAQGSEHAEASTLNNLALLYRAQGRYAEAEALLKRAVAINEKVLGPEHPDLATALNTLAEVYRAQGRYAEAEVLLKRTLFIREKVLGPQHPNVADALNTLAVLYHTEGRYAEAEPLLKRVLAIREMALGPEHPDVAIVLNNLAGLAVPQREWEQAASYWQLGTRMMERRAERGLGGSERGSANSEAVRNGTYFSGLIKMTDRLAPQGDANRVRQGREMFEKAQWAQASEAASSLSQMAARSAKGDTALAKLVRERQDLVGEWQAKDRQLIAAKGQLPAERNPDAEKVLSDRITAIDGRLKAIDAQFAKDFPEYASLTSPKPASVAEVQALLGPDEALVLSLDTDERFEPTPEETFIWVVTKGDMRWVKSELGTKGLAERVAALRCGLDRTAWSDASSWPEVTDQQKREKASQIARRQRCLELLKREPAEEMIEVGTKNEKIVVLPFDLTRAHELYKGLLGQVEDMIEGKRLLIVPSGPLTSIPFNVLITEPPKAGIPERLARYRDVAWLGARAAITVLPSVASLKALRQFAKPSRATKPYVGIGNPLLDGVQDDPLWGRYDKELAELARTKRCSQAPPPQQIALAAGPRSAHDFASIFRGTHADIEDVRSQEPLPETADELCEIARRLGVPESDILLGANATEGRLKDLSDRGRLADYAVVHFATHGILTGQVQGLAEPGLILTPPPKRTSDPKALERDDGFLTASEITTLKLDADWVVLSACNTAGPQDRIGAGVLLRWCPRPSGVALGGGLGRRGQAHHKGLCRLEGAP
jgi:tetratricopeptide (TPR) repeat protein/CHAT domain-containing protein